MKRLNLGCGYVHRDDWDNVDKVDRGNQVADILDGLPFDDDYYDFVLMNHTLQDFGYEQHAYVLEEVKRIMKKGATLRILTPDLRRAFAAVIEKNNDYFPIADKLEKTLGGKFARYVFWHGDTRSAFDVSALTDLLERNGFRDVHEAKYGECELDSREAESLIVVCKK